MKQLMKLFKASLKTTFREKQVWFWSIFFPVLLLVIFLSIMGGTSDKELKINVVSVTEQQDATSSELLTGLQSIPMLKWKEDQPVSLETAEQLIKDKSIDAAIVLPSNESPKPVEIIVNAEKVNSTTTQVIAGIMNKSLETMNYSEAHLTPKYSVELRSISSNNEDIKYKDFLLTGMIAMAISQAGLFGMVGLVEIRRNGLLKRLMLAPINVKLFGISEIMVKFVLAAVQIILLSTIGIVFYQANFHINILAFLPIFIVGTITFSAIGFMIASFSKTLESYMGIANLSSFLMMFLCGIYFDTSIMPDYIQPIAKVLPLTYFANGIRDSMVYGFGVMNSTYWLNIGIMAVWSVVTFFIASRLYKWKSA